MVLLSRKRCTGRSCARWPTRACSQTATQQVQTPDKALAGTRVQCLVSAPHAHRSPFLPALLSLTAGPKRTRLPTHSPLRWLHSPLCLRSPQGRPEESASMPPCSPHPPPPLPPPSPPRSPPTPASRRPYLFIWDVLAVRFVSQLKLTAPTQALLLPENHQARSPSKNAQQNNQCWEYAPRTGSAVDRA